MSKRRTYSILAIVFAGVAVAPSSAAASVMVWGNNGSDQLADGLASSEEPYSTVPVSVKGLPEEAVAVASNTRMENAFALEAGGAVYGFGGNRCGDLGDGDSRVLYEGHCEGWPSVETPTPVCTQPQFPCDPTNHLGAVTAITASAALRSDGTVYGWGSGYLCRCEAWGEVREYDTRPYAAEVPGLSNVTAIAEEPNLALLSDGHVSSWTPGALVASGPSEEPQELPGVSNVTAVAADGLLLLSNGTVEQWDKETNSVRVVEGLSEVAAVSTGLALKRNGTVWEFGELLESVFPMPVEVPLPNAAVAITSPRPAGCKSCSVEDYALLANGKIMAWGSNAPQHRTDLGIGLASGPEECTGWGGCARHPTEVLGLSNVSTLARTATAAIGSVQTRTFSGWHVSGSLSNARRMETGAVSSATFNGHEIDGLPEGTATLRTTYKLGALPLTFAITLPIGPEGGSLEVTSLSVTGLTLPIHCVGREPVASSAMEPAVFTGSEVSVRGRFTFPSLQCSGSEFSSSFLGFVLSALLSGEGNEYDLVMQP